MDKIFVETMYFGIVLSLLSYWIAVQIRKKFPYPLFNPLLMSALISIAVLSLFHINFDYISIDTLNSLFSCSNV